MTKIILSVIIILILFTSCDELLNPSSDYVIEKSVIATSEEQVFEAGNDFKIVFPPNAVNQNIEMKVKKESSAPTFSLSNMKLGSNLYKLSFKGFQSFAKTVNIYLKYDPSKIESGKTAEQSVKGMIYSNGTWKEANFEIDKVNSKIIFNINNLSSSSLKDEPVLMADDEIIIGDGYTTTDTGQSDNPLARYTYFRAFVTSNIYYDDGSSDEDMEWDLEYPAGVRNIVWKGNNFTLLNEKISPKDWITEYPTLPDSTIEVINGTVSKDGSIIVELKYEFYKVERTYYGESKPPDLRIETRRFTVNNLDIYVPDKNDEQTYPYVLVSGEDAGKYVKNLYSEIYNWRYDSFYGKIEESLLKSTSFNFKGSHSRIGVFIHKI